MPTTSAFLPSTSPTPRTRALAENPRLASRAVELLQSFQAFVRLSEDDARCVVPYLREVAYARGDLLFAAGDQSSSSYLLLLLEGEVAVDAGGGGPRDAVPISVLGAGSVLGEMALLDGAPRSATNHRAARHPGARAVAARAGAAEGGYLGRAAGLSPASVPRSRARQFSPSQPLAWVDQVLAAGVARAVGGDRLGRQGPGQ